MKLDHLALRTTNRIKTAEFWIKAFGYRISEEFDIPFSNGTFAKSIALKPPTGSDMPELFISDGEEGSVVGDWVKIHGSGLHHAAISVDSVEQTMEEWKRAGYAEFTTSEPIVCSDNSMTQIFTKPSDVNGFVIELIKRSVDSPGFCAGNVKKLMESSKG